MSDVIVAMRDLASAKNYFFSSMRLVSVTRQRNINCTIERVIIILNQLTIQIAKIDKQHVSEIAVMNY